MDKGKRSERTPTRQNGGSPESTTALNVQPDIGVNKSPQETNTERFAGCTPSRDDSRRKPARAARNAGTRDAPRTELPSGSSTREVPVEEDVSRHGPTMGRILDRLPGAVDRSDYYQARCPAHDDHNASLTITEAEDGRVLVRCHAGCEFAEVVDALRLEQRDFFPQHSDQSPRRHRDGEGSSWNEVAAYDYRDADGSLVYQSVRRERTRNGEREKKFVFRRPDPDHPGEWIYNLNGVKRYLYREHECAEHQQVFTAEGEMDVDALWDRSQAAVCNSGGAGKWPIGQQEALRGKDVVILPDNDEPGLKHAQKVAFALRDVAKTIKVVVTSEAPKGDVSDWFEEGHGADELLALVSQTPEWDGEKFAPDGRAETSPSNGRQGGRKPIPVARFANSFWHQLAEGGNRPGLCFYKGSWFKFDGTCYRRISLDNLESDVMAFIRQSGQSATRNLRDNVVANLKATDLAGLPAEAENPCWLQKGYPGAKGWLPMRGRVVNAQNLARFVGGEEISEADLFSSPTPDLFCTFGVDYPYDPEAQCPRWLDYLAGVQPVEADRTVLQKMIAYCLTPNTGYCVMFCLVGPGGTGKSTFLHVFQHLIGKDNVCCLPLADFGQRFRTWQLAACLVNLLGEMPTETERGGGLHQIEGILKDVCDGGLIPVEHKFAEPASASAIARCVFACNAMPRFFDRSDALWDRLRVLAFDQRFRDTARENRNLRHEVVAEELPGVFNWAVEGLAMLQGDRTFPEHSRGLELKFEHRRSCEPERVFLEELYERGSADDHVETREVYSHYQNWTAENGYHPLSEGNFAKAVSRVHNVRKGRVRTDDGQHTVYKGLKLQDI